MTNGDEEATRQPGFKAITTKAVSRMASGKNESPTGAQAVGRKTSRASKEAESPLQRSMQEVMEGKHPYIFGCVPNPSIACQLSQAFKNQVPPRQSL